MEKALRAGIAIYNDGEYHAAHDAWEEPWLDLQSGADDEQFLHGLIQFTAAVYHARNRNWSGATGLARSGGEYLAGLPATYRGVAVGDVRRYLERLADDPEVIERCRPLRLQYDGEPIRLEDLTFGETCLAAEILAEEYDYDESRIEAAIRYAHEDGPESGTGPFVPLLFDFVLEPENRDVIVTRLGAHVDRRKRRDADVESLFEDESAGNGASDTDE